VASKMAKQPNNVLPQSLAPRGLSREQAAAYVGISPSLFDMLVKDGRMPGPKRINSRVIWDRLKLEAAFEALADTEDGGTDDQWKVAV
jgi:predicted DNA-binding transcriptional regulator AlpA